MLNLSRKKLTDIDYILLGKGLQFCPKPKSHDKIKLAEEIFNFSRRLKLKEFFYDKSSNNSNCESDSLNSKNMGYFNKDKSSFTPPSGRDSHLDFYIEAITQEILHSIPHKRGYSNISKKEMESLHNLINDDSIVIKKADKSNNIII